jgi:hypothetical protein
VRSLQIFVIQIPSSSNKEEEDDSIGEEFKDASHYPHRESQIFVEVQDLCRGHNVRKS